MSTPLLGLALPLDGTTNWGTLVNASVTALLDSAIAGTTTLSVDADVTLSTTVEASNQARQAVLLCTGARTAARTLVAPAQSKTYVVINSTTGGYGVKICGTGPTTGVTVPAGQAYLVAWNGSDFVVTGKTQINLATDVTGTLPVANGGTGVTTSTGTGAVVLSDSPTLTGTIVFNSVGTPGVLTNYGSASVTKKFTAGVNSIASASTVTPTSDDSNQYNVTALAVPATFAAPSGTPVDGQKLLLRIKDNGTARALTWNAIYRVIGTTLPATTVVSKTTYVGCVYNSADATWDVVTAITQV